MCVCVCVCVCLGVYVSVRVCVYNLWKIVWGLDLFCRNQ